MCGILGYVSKDKIDRDLFESSLDTLSKRGPDAKGIFATNIQGRHLVLGHKRLSVLDLTAAANQPMISEDGNFVIVFNGEIYNHPVLKKELLKKGYQFRTTADTEVLLKGFIDSGQKIAEKIEGMFAFAILDKKKATLTFARDHFGKKPLLYYLDANTFAFASELKTLLKFPHIKNRIKLDSLSLIKYLLYGYIPSPKSIFVAIKKLEPSTTFQFNLKTWKVESKKRYWELEKVQLNNKITEPEALEKLECLLLDAVKKRLLSDVPLGVFLSGGIDSSLVTALAAQNLDKVSAFTVAYRDYQDDEALFAKMVGKHLGISISFGYFEKEKVKESLLQILDYLDEPLADPAIVPLYYIAKFARPHIKVALSGDGGDEIFGGYPKYQAQVLAERLKYFGFLILLAKNAFLKDSLARKALEGIGLPFYARQFVYGGGGFLPGEVKGLLNLDCLDLDKIFSEARQYNALFGQKDLVNRMLYLDCKLQLPDWYLAKVDRAAAAASIEIRSPLLDRRLAEFAFSLDGGLKLRRGKTKYLLKKVARRYLPRQVVYRKKKGFQLPLKEWLRGDFFYLTTFDNLSRLGAFNTKHLLNLKRNLLAGAYGSETKLWRLIILDNFVGKYL